MVTFLNLIFKFNFFICPFLLWFFFLNVIVTYCSTRQKEIIIIRSLFCCTVQNILYRKIFFVQMLPARCSSPPPLAAREWGPSSAGQWETSMLRRRNMDHPRCWCSEESGISGYRMPHAVDWRSIHHHYTGLGKPHTSCETVHDFWVQARVYIDTFLSDIWLGLNTVLQGDWSLYIPSMYYFLLDIPLLPLTL